MTFPAGRTALFREVFGETVRYADAGDGSSADVAAGLAAGLVAALEQSADPGTRTAHVEIDVYWTDRAPTVGASWRGHYDRLRLHTVRWLSDLPGLRFPRRWSTTRRRAPSHARCSITSRRGYSARSCSGSSAWIAITSSRRRTRASPRRRSRNSRRRARA